MSPAKNTKSGYLRRGDTVSEVQRTVLHEQPVNDQSIVSASSTRVDWYLPQLNPTRDSGNFEEGVGLRGKVQAKTEKALLVTQIRSAAGSDWTPSSASSARVDWSSPLLDRTGSFGNLAEKLNFRA